MAQRDVVVVGAARTAIGDYGGSLKDVPATALGATAIRKMGGGIEDVHFPLPRGLASVSVQS